jgi:hypothetical protein
MCVWNQEPECRNWGSASSIYVNAGRHILRRDVRTLRHPCSPAQLQNEGPCNDGQAKAGTYPCKVLPCCFSTSRPLRPLLAGPPCKPCSWGRLSAHSYKQDSAKPPPAGIHTLLLYETATQICGTLAAR